MRIMGKSKLFITVKRDTEDLTLIRLGNAMGGGEVESTHDFLVLPAYYNCLVRVEDENGKEVHSKFHDLSPWYTLSSAFCNEEELDEDELDELKETQNYWNNLKFDDTSALLYKPVLEQLKDADADAVEETFIFNLLKGSVKGMETCDIEVGDCCDYPKFTVEYDIEIPDGEEFDIEKLNFFNVDIEDPGCWEDLNFAITEDKLFLDTIIYDGKVYTGSTGPEKIIPNSCIAHIEVETFTELDEV